MAVGTDNKVLAIAQIVSSIISKDGFNSENGYCGGVDVKIHNDGTVAIKENLGNNEISLQQLITNVSKWLDEAGR